MATATKTRKEVQVIARYFVKRTMATVYAVRPSNGGDPYYTTVVRGHATNCTCPARKPCYHMTQLEEREQAIIASDKTFAQAVDDLYGDTYSSDPRKEYLYGCTNAKEEERTRLNYYEMSIGVL